MLPSKATWTHIEDAFSGAFMNEKATAYHEAAHAVMHHLVGDHIVNVTIAEEAETWGRVRVYVKEDAARQWRRWATAMAGSIAERWISDNVVGAEDDFERRDDAIDEVFADITKMAADTGVDKKELADAVFKIARTFEELIEAIVTAHRPAIEALAAELLVRKTMSGKEVHDFLASHGLAWHKPRGPAMDVAAAEAALGRPLGAKDG
jgi:ATP-dependent Zn protease